MTSIYAIDEQGNRHVLAASPARADVVNGTLLDGIEVPGARLAVLQDVHPDVRYVLNVEIAPSASRGLAVQSIEIPFTNGWNVAETATAEPAAVPADKQDPVLPETDPRRHYDLPRNTQFDRVRDASTGRPGEQEAVDSTNHSSVAAGARLRVEETAVPENDMEKTLTFTGEGFEGSGSVALQVYALGSDGRTVGDAVASGDARVEDGSFSAHLRVPGSALKPGTTYRVSAIYEDSRGTVQIVTGGFTVERDGVDASHPSDSLSAERVEAPATEKPADKKPSVTPSQSAPASAAESKEPAPVASASEAPASAESASSAPASVATHVAERAGQKSQKATGLTQKGEREQLAATGASGMLVISAVGSLSLAAGVFLTRRGHRDVRLTSRS